MSIDDKDMKLLKELENDSSQSLKQLAEKLSLPVTTVHYRKTKLEETGIIRKYKAVIDRKSAGFSISLLIFSNAEELPEDERIEMVFRIKSANWNTVMLCRFRDERDMNEFIERLRHYGVKDISPLIVEEVVE